MEINGIIIRFAPIFVSSGRATARYNWEQRMFIEAQPSGLTPFEDFRSDIFYHIQNFITLGVGRAVYPIEVTARMGATEGEPEAFDANRIIQVYYAIRGRGTHDPIYPAEMLFSFPMIRDQYEQSLRNWFKKAPILKPIYDLYFSTMYSPKMYLESRFLSLAQAIETYHRRIIPGSYLNDELFTDVYDAIIQTLKGFTMLPDARDSFIRKLRYLNEFSLRRRIREVLASCAELVEVLIPNRDQFILNVVNTRNYLTHYEQKLEPSSVTGPDLYLLAEQLRFILEQCLLKEMGLSEECREKIVKKNISYLRLKSIVK